MRIEPRILAGEVGARDLDAVERAEDGEREARVRIVFRRIGAIADLTELAFEFEDVDDFWGLNFPPEGDLWENAVRHSAEGRCRK